MTYAAINKCCLAGLAMFLVVSIACQEVDRSNPGAAQQASANAASSNATSSATNLANANQPVAREEPRIKITNVPSKGAGPDALETIAGTVEGVNVKECKVIVFARTNIWYVQPYFNSSDTAINGDGTWRTDTHLGSQYAALLVRSSYKPPPTTGKLPEIGGLVLAVATADATH